MLKWLRIDSLIELVAIHRKYELVLAQSITIERRLEGEVPKKTLDYSGRNH